jgi:transcription termination/antitermination protein NusG
VESVEHRWYAIQTTAGHENKVRSLIQRRIDGGSRAPEERPIRQALVPTQEVVEIKNGKKVNVERKLYPATCWSRCSEPGDPAHVNSIQGVIKFVGHEERAAAAAPRGGQPPARHRRGGRSRSAEGGDPVPGRPGGGDHRGPLHRLQRHGRGSAADKGKVRVSVSPLRTADEVELDYLQLKGY